MVPLITHSQTRNAGLAELTSDPLANVQTLAECLTEWQRRRVLNEPEVQQTPLNPSPVSVFPVPPQRSDPHAEPI